ncbi:WD40 repeat-like protein, partial [Martensiomyces pterosporus]
FFKGAKWSPDGTMVAAHLEDNSLRLYDVSNAVSSFSSKEQHESAAAVHSCRSLQTICHGETLVDYAWYPYMSRYDPALCCLVESTRDHPLHLRDTNSGKVRASYVAYDSKDVLMTASAVAFSPDAGSILAGYNGSIARFDMQRPGLPVDQVATTPTRRSRDGMKGIVSCIAVSPATAPAKMVACGSFSGQMSLRSLGQLEASCIGVWPAPAEYGGRGVTQLKWSPDGMLLWVASRQSMHIVGWDVRDMRGPWAVVLRDSLTQQRMGFDLDATGRHIVAGEMDGCVAFHDIYAEEGQQQRARMRMHGDLVSDVCSHPYYPLLATTSGQRHF